MIFSLMVSLAELWRSFGVEPDVVVGHSQGEVAAAHVAGALSLADAARIVAVRSRMIAEYSGEGGLVSIAMPVDRLEPYLEHWGGRIEIAALNGPSSAVLTGDREALDELLARCAEEEVRARNIPGAVAASHSAQMEALRDDLLEALSPISPRSCEIPFHSTVSGEPIDTAGLDGEYWYRNTRQPVLFEPVMRRLVQQRDAEVLIEVSSHPVLLTAVQETIEASAEHPGAVAALGTLRRNEGGPRRFALSLAQAHAAGARVDWDAVFAGTGAKAVDLPTYPFQRESFWLAASASAGDPSTIGQAAAGHPLLDAVLDSPDGAGLVFTGRVSLQTHPWLADHAAFDTVLLPGAAFMEMALRAGAEVGAGGIDELTLEAPLILAEQGAVHLRVAVGEPDAQARREVSIHSRPEQAAEEDEPAAWSRHASGVLAAGSGEAVAAARDLTAWPPQGAEPMAVDGLYDRLAERGVDYGPAFQGLTAAWQDGEEIYAEVSLPAAQAEEAPGFAIHPALVDATAHAGIDRALADGDAVEAGKLPLPFAWRGVRASGSGATSLRVWIGSDGNGGGRLQAADGTGAPVLSVDSIVMRQVEQGQLRAASGLSRSLHRLRWQEVQPQPASPEQEAVAEPAIADFRSPPHAGDRLAASHAIAVEALERLQAWLLGEETEGQLIVLTEGALCAAEGEDPDLATAAMVGLVRSAQSEQPGRFALIDTDGSEPSQAALASAYATAREHPQLALRQGKLLAPRLTRAIVPPQASAPASFAADRTVLITGGTGGLGGLFARHLVVEHGVGHLLLVSRSGEEAAGAKELREELEGLGAEVAIAACDVGDRAQLEQLLGSIPADRPLGAVIHSAGVLDDGMLGSLDASRLQRVMAPKADAAWHLHELTAEMELSAFVLFSSVMGVLGSPGQANYAAANTFLDALAAHRRAQGLPAHSLAWGGWGQLSSMVDGEVGEEALRRLAEQVRQRLGLVPMPPEHGLALLDLALALPDPMLVPVAFDGAVLRSQAAAGTLPVALTGLVRVPTGRERGSLAERLAGVSEAEREGVVLDLVRSHIAAVLGHASAEEVDPGAAFKDLGFDSLAAVELRNRLVAATDLRLPQTIVFDYPTSAALAKHLSEQVAGGAARSQPAVRAAASSSEPIAIVGMACRYPGSANSPAQLWELLASGTDAITAFPQDRGWDLDRLYHPDPDRIGTSYAREGGFLDDAAGFDPAFFSISPREAIVMDPQERTLLESCWEALEDGGVDPHRLRGSETGVFAGVMYQDYGVADYGAGMTSSGVSGRVSYTLGFEGPAITVDTACSSSLVAMHLAAQALRAGECELALAGGVTVLATPGIFSFFSRQRALAPDGRCKSFADSADGTGVAEGSGVLLLERLSAAERNGHPILATIRGSAVNQDGASNGFTAPNGPSQERVIRQALANAGLSPRDVDAVEAHGTGTVLGDPIEAGALLATYGQDRETPLRLGSLKSNIGHTQAAAGVGGVIKTVMAMREGMLPKTLHVGSPSSKVEWDTGKIELLTEAQPWQANGRPRRGAVSSFGASGTNAHVILEEAPVPEPQADPAPADPDGGAAGESSLPARALAGPIPLVLSARTEPALRAVAQRLAAHVEASPELDPVDIAYSLAATRASLERRAVVLGSSGEELLARLAALAAGEPTAGVLEGRAAVAGKLAYLFSGQGSQRPGMGEELYAAYPVYAAAFDEACAALDPYLERPLQDIVFSAPGSAEAELLDHTSYAQPALFATEVAIFRLLAGFGLRPDLLAGHSIGEVTAAHLAEVLSLPDAARLVASRGRRMGELPAGGAMLAIQASEEEARESIEGREAELSLAAINSPASVVVSGSAAAIGAVEEHWRAAGRKTKRLAVSHAFHSPLMEPMLAEFEAVARELTYHEPRLTIVSNLSGEVLAAERAMDPAYWVAHVREPVRFADAIACLEAKGATAYLEIGPDAVLTAMAQESVSVGSERPPVFAPSLRAERPEVESLSAAIAQAHAAGAGVDWEAFFAGSGAQRVPLPTYPFERQRFWLSAPSAAGDLGAAGLAEADHPLLAAVIDSPAGEGIALSGRISLQTHPWLADHAAFDTVLLPGAALVELAIRAGAEVGCELLEELTLQTPLILPEQGAVQLQVSLGGAEQGRHEVAIHSRPVVGEDEAAGEWTVHAEGVLAPRPADPDPRVEALAAAPWPPEGTEPIDVEHLYDRLAERGIEYGTAFQCVRAAWRRDEEVFAELALPEEQAEQAGGFGLHPALLDSVGHVAADLALSAAGEAAPSGVLPLPFAWRGVVAGSGGAAAVRVQMDLNPAGGGFVAVDHSGAHVTSVEAVALRPVERSQLQAFARRRSLYRLRWQAVAKAAPSGAPPRLAIVGEAGIAGLDEVERHPDLPALCEAIGEGAAPAIVVVSLGARAPQGQSPVGAAHANAARVLELAQAWLGAPGLGASRLVLLAEGAVSAAEGERPDLATAPLWGLLRSAQSEHPGSFSLIDTDASEASAAALRAALAATEEEPQLAIREGELSAPRLARVEAEEQERAAEPIDPEATVLITGGTSGLGAIVARHLAAAHGARQLLLVSRSGAEAEGAAELSAELEELGAAVRIAACDVADREQLEALIASIPPQHPLGAVIHSAGVLDDGVLASLDRERLERVMRPKLDAAWSLHKLTEHLELSRFLLFSSISGIVGGPGQANYAAANTFLDALAAHRRTQGLPAHSLAWGGWEEESGMTGGLAEADRARAIQTIRERVGLTLMPTAQGLDLFDTACASAEPLLVAAQLDSAALRARAETSPLPPVLRAIVRAPRGGPVEKGSLAKRLAAVPEGDREEVALELIRGHIAAVLGHESGAEIEPDRAFKDLGFDSLAAVELRNRLSTATGLHLSPTLVFDYPTAAALSGYLVAEVSPDESKVAAELKEAEVREAISQLEGVLGSVKADPQARERVGARLRSLLVDLSGSEPADAEAPDDGLESMSHEEMFELIDAEFGGEETDG